VLDLNDFLYFVQVVDRGGFTAAGRTLRVPKSTLSHRIQQLETELGARLLNRTSRQLAMTDAGEEFYRHAVVMLREAELAETAIRHRLNEPMGTVRCTAAMATMQFAMRDIVAEFLGRYPKVNVRGEAGMRPRPYIVGSHQCRPSTCLQSLARRVRRLVGMQRWRARGTVVCARHQRSRHRRWFGRKVMRRLSRRRILTSAAALAASIAAPYVRSAHAAGQLALGLADHWVH
jgi:DNA-binding transcriptional LysR family regulator